MGRPTPAERVEALARALIDSLRLETLLIPPGYVLVVTPGERIPTSLLEFARERLARSLPGISVLILDGPLSGVEVIAPQLHPTVPPALASAYLQGFNHAIDQVVRMSRRPTVCDIEGEIQ